MRVRADELLVRKGLVRTRSQAASLIKMGNALVGQRSITKPGELIDEKSDIKLSSPETYVSRAGHKLASVANKLPVDFKNKVVLDVGSSTGGFTDFALQNGAKKIIAVDVGSKQLHPTLRDNPKIELHEQLDVRHLTLDVREAANHPNLQPLTSNPDIILVDVSFISLREILPHCSILMTHNTQLLAMVKPQFEARETGVKHKGVIKNKAMRRKVLKDFELWAKNVFIVLDKADSEVTGSKGNIERFYLLKKPK